jgi:membrane protein YdbS with pleckstrin-like domain
LSKELRYQFETYCKNYELRYPLISFFFGVIAIVALSLFLMVTAPIFGSDPLPLIIFLIIFGVPSYYAILNALLREVIRISICPEDVVITRGLIQRKTIYIPITRIAHVDVKDRYVLVFRSPLQ